MCLPECHEVLSRRFGRRGLLAGAVAAGLAVLPIPTARADKKEFSKVVDLTHVLSPEFPTFGGSLNFEMEAVAAYDSAGYNVNRWHLIEHTGTHIDAPLHFLRDGIAIDQVEPEKLVVPLAVIDLRERSAADPNTRLMPEDIHAWEAEHGPLPENCCVAINSGWSAFATTPKFRNLGADDRMHFPGIHSHTANMLINQRNVTGLAVDTLSLDYGTSKDFATHYAWLGAGRWGIECMANLDEVPPRGATLVVGAPKIKGATGCPSRLFALV